MMNFRQYTNLTRVVIPNNITLSTGNFNNAFNNMKNLVISEFNHPNVTNMYCTYYYCDNLTGAPVCGTNVTSMTNTYYNCSNLTGAPVCGTNITSMVNTYFNCSNLTGAPVCGTNVTSMYFTYFNCRNLTGSPVCGNNVVMMFGTYYNCRNLTGSPVCGPNVTSMFNTYVNCINLTGSPVCGNNVTDMSYSYYNCTNLTGLPVCGENVTNMSNAYRNCANLNAGNIYFYSANIANVCNCFNGKKSSRRYNIYVPANSRTLNTCLINNKSSLSGANITWTNAGTYYYNAIRNIYIYPVANVAAAYEAEKKNILIDFKYIDNGDGTYTITDWKDTYQGEASTRCVIPDYDWIKY